MVGFPLVGTTSGGNGGGGDMEGVFRVEMYFADPAGPVRDK